MFLSSLSPWHMFKEGVSVQRRTSATLDHSSSQASGTLLMKSTGPANATGKRQCKEKYVDV